MARLGAKVLEGGRYLNLCGLLDGGVLVDGERGFAARDAAAYFGERVAHLVGNIRLDGRC